jgi:hypothetical protein
MTLSRENLLELMALADGELEGEARDRAERLAAESDEARRVVEGMRTPLLSAWLAETLDERSAAADGIAGAVMAKIERAKADAGIEGVVRLSGARARRSSGVTRGQLAVLGGVLALAATILLYVRADRDTTGVPGPVASVEVPVVLPSAGVATTTSASASTALAQQGAHPAQGVEVDEIDSPAHGVTVFEIPVGGMAAAASGGNPSSVVIMIDDEPVKP